MRRGAIPAAAIVLLAFPIVVALFSQEPQPPAPIEGSLTIRMLAPGPWSSGPFDDHLLLSAVGPAPGPALLKTEDGTAVVTVTPETDPAKCAGLPVHDTATGGSPSEETQWCLFLSSLMGGKEFAGTLVGQAAEGDTTTQTTGVELTLNVRDNYKYRPLVVTALGFVIAFLIVIWPKALKGLVKASSLKGVLTENRHAGANELVGLDAWVSDRLAHGSTAEKLLPKVAAAVRQGPRQDSEAREALRKALQGDPLGADHPYVVAASSQTGWHQLKATDFLTEEGELSTTPLPAALWQAGLASLIEREADLKALLMDAQAFAGTPCEAEAATAWDAARRIFQRTASPETIDELDDQIGFLRQKLVELRARPECRAPGKVLSAADKPGSRGLAPGFELSLALDPQFGPDAGIGLAFVLTVVVVAVWALVSVAFAIYVPKPSFGTITDYWELLVAAVGSTFAGTVLALIAYWDRNEPADAPA